MQHWHQYQVDFPILSFYSYFVVIMDSMETTTQEFQRKKDILFPISINHATFQLTIGQSIDVFMRIYCTNILSDTIKCSKTTLVCGILKIEE